MKRSFLFLMVIDYRINKGLRCTDDIEDSKEINIELY